MKYYDESGNEITNPDLTKGSVTEKTRIIGIHQRLLDGTEGRGEDGNGLYEYVEDIETYGVYHVYTADELAEKKRECASDALEEQVTQLQVAVTYLFEQLTK